MGTLDIRSARTIAREIGAGRLRATDVLEAALARVEAEEPRVGAFTTVLHEQARERALAIDATIHTPGGGPLLLGVPFALKDNLCTAGVPTTASSRILRGLRARRTPRRSCRACRRPAR